MAQHVKIIGILHIVFSSLLILAGVICLLVMGGIAGMVGTTSHSSDDLAAVPLLGGIGGLIFLLFLILGLPGVIGGIGLIQYKPWARIVIIVLSVVPRTTTLSPAATALADADLVPFRYFVADASLIVTF